MDLPAKGLLLSRARIESLSSRALAGFGLVFMVQVVPAVMTQAPRLYEPWGIGIAGLLCAGLVWVAVAALLQRGVAIAAGTVAVGYLIAVASWPLLAVNPSAVAPDVPWLWYICTVATGFAALAFRPIVGGLYTVVTPMFYGAIRLTPSGGAVGITEAILDAVYAIILGGAILVILSVLRQASTTLDRAQRAALDRYGAAAREHAMEAERVEVDAFVHDSVLTTLLMAAAANSPEEMSIATRMASNTIGQLDGAVAIAPGAGEEVAVAELGSRIQAAAESMSADFPVTVTADGEVAIPAGAAEALYAAAVQAMVNSVQHAGAGARHNAILDGRPADGDSRARVAIEIVDDGAGFDPADVPPGRLGVKVSIKERLARSGGAATVRSAPGAGTIVSLVWPAGAVSKDDAS